MHNATVAAKPSVALYRNIINIAGAAQEQAGGSGLGRPAVSSRLIPAGIGKKRSESRDPPSSKPLFGVR